MKILALFILPEVLATLWVLLAVHVHLALLAVVWRTGIQIPELSYNVLLFAPLVFAANLRLAGRGAGTWRSRGTALAEGPHAGQDAVMVQQSYTGLTSPPALPGYHLVENRFLPRPGRLLGIKVANTVPGYGYAVYVLRTGVNR